MTNALQGFVDGMAKPVDDHVNVSGRRNIGWRQQDVVADAPVNRSARRVAGKSAFERSRLDPVVKLEAGIDRLSRGAIGDEFDRREQAAAADVADMPVIAQGLGQSMLELRGELLQPVERPLLAE